MQLVLLHRNEPDGGLARLVGVGRLGFLNLHCKVLLSLTCAICSSSVFSPSFKFSEEFEDSDVFSLLGNKERKEFLEDGPGGSHSTAAIPVFQNFQRFTLKAKKDILRLRNNFYFDTGNKNMRTTSAEKL